jgi:NAD(P)-dependent dehydrogenase (short-subunit alcohol dehydrogenase family)
MTENWFRQSLLKGKTTVITGGAGLIGQELVKGFAEVGSNIIVADIDHTKGTAIAKKHKGSNSNILFKKLNITSVKSIDGLIKDTASKFGGIDVWINCAYPRTADWGADLDNISYASLKKNVDMHMNGYFLCCQSIARHMKKRKSGSIINFGSIYGLVAPRMHLYKNTKVKFPAPYPLIKGGIIQLTRYLGAVLASDGIRVNAICPGGVFDGQDKKFVKMYSENTPMGRMARAREVVGPAIFLASDAASYITGQILVVDGGWTAW